MSAVSSASVAATDRYPIRVFVMDAWDTVQLQVDEATTVGQLKREALRHALKRAPHDDQEYLVKFRGAAVDEAQTLGALSARANAPFIVMPARRQPVR
jgi:hypothetical protein